jgi:acyl-CoA hydrolase
MVKKASESRVVMTEMVQTNDTNHFGNLIGGRLMYWMDIAGAMVAMKHSESPCVTVSVDNITFDHPIKLGDIVHIEAGLTRTFKTSMEIHIIAWGEDPIQKHRYKSNEAYITFVSIDGAGIPKPVNELLPETEEEKKLFEAALRRRQIRLMLSGKMKPHDIEELKSLFF